MRATRFIVLFAVAIILTALAAATRFDPISSGVLAQGNPAGAAQGGRGAVPPGAPGGGRGRPAPVILGPPAGVQPLPSQAASKSTDNRLGPTEPNIETTTQF